MDWFKKSCIIFLLLLSNTGIAASGRLFNVTSSGNVLSIRTTIPHHIYPNAGIKINTPGYSLTNAGIECTPSAKGYCLFTTSDTISHEITISGSIGEVSVTLCLNGIGPFSCEKNTTNMQRYAYITNIGGPPVSQCAVTSSGALTSCLNSGATINPSTLSLGIAINPARTLAYITTAEGTIRQCSINQNTGALSACIDSVSGLGLLESIVFNTAGNFAYITDASNNSIVGCTVDTITDVLTSCVNFNSAEFDSPEGLVLNKSGNILYVVNFFSSTVTRCNVNSIDGALSSCQNSLATGLDSPVGIQLNTENTYAYISNFNKSVTQCIINPPNGNLIACVDTATTLPTGSEGITLNTSNTLAYVLNSNNTISHCDTHPVTGALETCQDSGATSLNFPFFMVFN